MNSGRIPKALSYYRNKWIRATPTATRQMVRFDCADGSGEAYPGSESAGSTLSLPTRGSATPRDERETLTTLQIDARPLAKEKNATDWSG